MKRFRFRFSIRTLVIVVTLACCYAACWGPTKKIGDKDVFLKTWDYGEAVAPLVIAVDVEQWTPEGWRIVGTGTRRQYRQYYFWFFGYVSKLPFEREL